VLTYFGSQADSIYYVDELGDTSKVAKDTNVLTYFGAQADSIYYVDELGDTSKVAKDTNVLTYFGLAGDSIYYVDENSDSSKVFVDTSATNELITAVAFARDDTLRVTEAGVEHKVFSANTMAEIYDAAGAQAIGNTFTNINLGTTSVADAGYTIGANSITIPSDGRYRVTYRVTLERAAGNNRTEAEHQLLRGAGVIPGSYAATYHRNSGISKGTASVTRVLDLDAGDVIRVQSRVAAGTMDLQTVINGSMLSVEKL
jgi:hypothetical protein